MPSVQRSLLLSHWTEQQCLLAQAWCLCLRAKINHSKRWLGLEPLQAKDYASFHAAEANFSVLSPSCSSPRHRYSHHPQAPFSLCCCPSLMSFWKIKHFC